MWLWLAGGTLAFACGEDRSFGDGPGAEAGQGGERTSASGSDAGGNDSVEAGSPSGGSAGAGGVLGGDAGAAGAPIEPGVVCPGGYQTWLSSRFSFPDGPILGTADFPSMPWGKLGALAIDGGRLNGTGTALVSQGISFAYVGSRLRFRARFSESKQLAAIAFNAANDGSGGLRITVDAAGKIILAEGKVSVAEAELGPLENGVDWFVEAVLDGLSANATLARGDYGSTRNGYVEAELQTTSLKANAGGTKLAAELVSSAGLSPTIDDILFERCSLSPPSYEPQFVDTFERPDSSNLGTAEVPATSSWERGQNGSAVINEGALEIGALASVQAEQGEQLQLEGLRARVAFSTKDMHSWLSFYFNKPSSVSAATDLGFWVWGDAKGVVLDVFAGDRRQEQQHPEVKFNAGATLFAELDVDSGLGVVTLREGSFDGPIVAVENETGIVTTSGTLLVLDTQNGFEERGTVIHEVRVDRYSP